MSAIDEKKREKEAELFELACQLSEENNINPRTKSIMKYLNGIRDTSREKSDRPDIINWCKKAGTNYIVGIEVFRVDQNSRKKRGKIRSESCENKAKLDKTRSLAQSQYEHTGKLSNEMINVLLKDNVEYAKGHINSDYDSFIGAFREHFNSHSQNIPYYIKTLQNIGDSAKVELAFLIEIEYCANDLFSNHNGIVKSLNECLMPFYKEIVSIVNSAENKELLDYIVFLIRNPQNTEQQVIAVRSKNFKKNLLNQDIVIYEYVGENLAKIQQYSVDEERKIKITPNDVSNMEIEEIVYPLYEKARNHLKKGIPFVTSRMVQHLLYVLPYAQTKEEAHCLSRKFSEKYTNKNNEVSV